MRVVCAMSGGVDSSLAAALMVEAGHEVVGMTMRLYNASEAPGKGRGGTCCSPAEVDQAREVCDQLGVRHYTVDESERFSEHVIGDFAREYASGRTPNPCVRCNEHVKFAPLLARAQAISADLLVTGHYARIENGYLMRGVDPAKDQSYFLFAMGESVLPKVHFPLGGWRKEAVRDRARELNLPNWDAPDSVELCFVGGRSHSAVVEQQARDRGLDTSALGTGSIVDRSGKVVGSHQGIHTVTVGQRRGLRVAGTEARYVLRVLPERREVVVGGVDELTRSNLLLRDLRWFGERPTGSIRAFVQIRHRTPASMATVEVVGESARVCFDEPVRAVAPGQAGVIYAGDRVLGGGWIEVPAEPTGQPHA